MFFVLLFGNVFERFRAFTGLSNGGACGRMRGELEEQLPLTPIFNLSDQLFSFGLKNEHQFFLRSPSCVSSNERWRKGKQLH